MKSPKKSELREQCDNGVIEFQTIFLFSLLLGGERVSDDNAVNGTKAIYFRGQYFEMK